MESSWSRFVRLFCVIAGTFSSALISNHAAASSSLTGFYNNADGSPLVELINQAQVSLDLEIYEMDDPSVISAIRAALSRGIKVHIVKEPSPVGGSCKVFGDSRLEERRRGAPRKKPAADNCADQQELVREVNESGGRYVPFAKPQLCGEGGTKSCLEHGKLAIADDRVALISSGNFNTTSLCDLEYSPRACNRDYTYVVEDSDVVQTLQRVVERDLVGDAYDVESVMAPGTDRKITIGPNSLHPLISLIQSARQSILIENQYLKEPQINQALMEAAKKGVNVQVMVSSVCSFGPPHAAEARKLRAIFSQFEEAGVQIRIFDREMKVDGKAGYLHAKAIVVDGNLAWMGSVNGSTQATELNREFGVFFQDPDQVGKLASIITSDLSSPESETWQESLECARDR